MNVNHHATGIVITEPNRIDMRVNHAPLPGPISADAVVAVDYATLHAVRPDNIMLHRR